MKKDLSTRMIIALLGLVLMTQSCSFFKRPQGEIFEQNERALPSEMCDAEPPDFYPEEFEFYLTKLLEIQGFLFNDAMVADINHASSEMLENGKRNLFENSHEIANLFSTIYGSEAAYRIEKLLNQEVVLFFDYLNAIKSQNKIGEKKTLAGLYANGHLLVELINILNSFFAYEPEKYMLDEHVTLLSNQAMAYVKGNVGQAEELNDRTIKQLKELAIHITKAIRNQYKPACFPETCRESLPEC